MNLVYCTKRYNYCHGFMGRLAFVSKTGIPGTGSSSSSIFLGFFPSILL